MADSKIGAPARQKIASAWDALLAAVASGGNIGAACEAAGVTRSNVYSYMRENDVARRAWEIAREESADAYADQIGDMIGDNFGKLDAQVARVKLDALRWLAAKRNPRAYSDKATLDVNVRQVDLTRIIEAAAARLAVGQVGRILDADIVPPALLELL